MRCRHTYVEPMKCNFTSMQVVAHDATRRCGVKDYAERLASAMQSESSSVFGVPLPHRHVSRFNYFRMMRLRRGVARQARMASKASLVHVQYADFSWNGVRAFEDCYEVFTRRCNTPLVVTLHEHPWFRGEHEMDQLRTVSDFIFSCLAGYWSPPKSLPLEVLSRNRGIHVHHKWQKNMLLVNGVPERKIQVVPLSIPECKAAPSQQAAFRKRFGLDGMRIIGITGFVFERKRYDRVVNLLPDLPADVVLCVLGGANGSASERYLEKLMEQAKTLGVLSRFVVTGYLSEPEMNAGLLETDLFMAPYGEVTSSASVSQCIGANGVIIAGNCTTFEEMAENGAGLDIVDPEDRAKMLSAVMGLLEKGDRYHILRRKNLNYSNTWSLQAVAGIMQEWYRECLER